MNNTKAIFLGLLACSVAAYAADSWTLEDCLKQAKKASLKLESAKLREHLPKFP